MRNSLLIASLALTASVIAAELSMQQEKTGLGAFFKAYISDTTDVPPTCAPEGPLPEALPQEADDLLPRIRRILTT